MSSILNNSAALSALQALANTQSALNTVQNQVSTGLAVATAADNSSYWSIAQQLTSDSGMVTASQTALSEGQSVLSTATSAIQNVLTTLNSMATQLTSAQTSGASFTNINTALASAGQQLTDAVNGASFNGLNVLNGSQTTLNFVSGYNASATGGAVNTIQFTASALYGLATATGDTSTTSTSTVSDSTSVGQIHALWTADSAKTDTISYSSPAATLGTDLADASSTAGTLTIQHKNADGSYTTTVYTALDTNGNSIAQGGSPTFATAASYSVTTTQTTPNSQNLLVQGSTDLTDLGTGGTAVTAGNAGTLLTAVNNAIPAITTYAGQIGATQNRMTAATTFNTALNTNYSNGVAGLVDADMNTASTRLQALQTQEQLGIQSLSIANQNAQLILKLFS